MTLTKAQRSCMDTDLILIVLLLIEDLHGKISGHGCRDHYCRGSLNSLLGLREFLRGGVI
jgi:hypothetical protein